MRNFVNYLPLILGWCVGQIIVVLFGGDATMAVSVCTHVALFALVASFIIRPRFDYNEMIQVAVRKVNEAMEKEGIEKLDEVVVELKEKEEKK